MKKPTLLIIVIPILLYSKSPLYSKTDTVNVKKGDTMIDTQKHSFIYLKNNDSHTDYFKYIWPVVTLLLGIAVNKGIERYSERRKIKKSGLRWAAGIRGLEEPIKKQIGLLNSVLLNENQMTYIPPKLELISTLDCDIFKSLDKSELFKFLQTIKNLKYNDAIKTSNTTHGYITTLEHLHDSLRKKFEEYQAGFSKQVSALNKDLQLLSKQIAFYGSNLEGLGRPVNQQNYPEYFQIFNLMDEHIFSKPDGNIDLFSLHEQLFKPMIYITAQLRRDKSMIPVIESLQDCINDIKGLKMEKRYWITNIETIITRYNEQIADLDNVVRAIDSSC